MKINTKISEIDHSTLVNLLSTSLYGSPYMDAIREGGSKAVGDTKEDKLADALLRGESIFVQDYYAEGDIYPMGYGKGAYIDKADDCAVYAITKESIERGLSAVLSMETHDDRQTGGWLVKCVNHLLDEDSDFDYTEADAIMQVVCFGEVVYG